MVGLGVWRRELWPATPSLGQFGAGTVAYLGPSFPFLFPCAMWWGSRTFSLAHVAVVSPVPRHLVDVGHFTWGATSSFAVRETTKEQKAHIIQSAHLLHTFLCCCFDLL